MALLPHKRKVECSLLDANTINTRRMNAQEKAKALVDKFTVVGLQQRNEGIECALICVDEIVNEIKQNSFDFGASVPMSVYTYWKNVKQEINKL